MARSTVSVTIDRIRRQLSSGYRNEINTLASAIDASQTTVPMTLTLTANVVAGSMLSIGTELLRVVSVDTASKTATVIRAFHDSTAAAHDAGAEVWINSRFTGLDIYDAMLEEIGSYGPQLYQVVTEELTVADSQETVELPVSMVGCYGIIDAHRQWTDVGSTTQSTAWPRANLRLVRYDPAVWSAFATSGLALRFIDPVAAGKVIVKAAMPYHTTFTLAQNLVTHGGLQQSMLDVLSMGVRLRLLQANEAGMSARTTQDEPRRAQEVPPGSLVQQGQVSQALYRNRKMEEINKLRSMYPVRFG
jgi:hypothetical protein